MALQTHTLHVRDITYETSDVIFLTFNKPEQFSFEAGQFISLEIKRDEKRRFKSYSIYSAPGEDELKLLIKLVPGGFASEYFKTVEVGDTLRMRGPLGRFRFNNETPRHVFIATGTGIAPLRSMIAEHTNEIQHAEILHGVRKKEDLITPQYYESLPDTFTYKPTLTRETWEGAQGRVQNHIDIKDDTTYYICGLKDLVLETTALLRNHEVDPKRIKHERYT